MFKENEIPRLETASISEYIHTTRAGRYDGLRRSVGRVVREGTSHSRSFPLPLPPQNSSSSPHAPLGLLRRTLPNTVPSVRLFLRHCQRFQRKASSVTLSSILHCGSEQNGLADAIFELLRLQQNPELSRYRQRPVRPTVADQGRGRAHHWSEAGGPPQYIDSAARAVVPDPEQ